MKEQQQVLKPLLLERRGSACTASDNPANCNDVVSSYTKTCTASDYSNGKCADKKYVIKGEGQVSCSTHYNSTKCKDTVTIKCSDEWGSSCSYGTLKNDVTKEVSGEAKTVETYCTQVKNITDNVQQDVREKANDTNENLKYRWDYVISTAKLFDNVISNEYKFEPYENYSTENYDKYINKTGEYANMTVENFSTSEDEKSKADSFSHNDEEYKDTSEKLLINDQAWNTNHLVIEIPSGVTLVSGTKETRTVYKKEKVIKEGKKYTDVYVWNDSLNFEKTNSGIYNVDSVKDVTGDDLSLSDTTYYQNLYDNEEINLIDILNSNKDIYTNYVASDDLDETTENIGIKKGKLDLSYNVLETDLKKLVEKYPLNGIKYGSTLGVENFSVLSGLNFGDVQNIAAGRMEGYNVAYPISNEEIGDSYLGIASRVGDSYGYAGHTGVDIAYNISAADKSLCSDYTENTCPFIRGPKVYAAMDGVIKEVSYSTYNKYYNVGLKGGVSSSDLTVNHETGWGSHIKVENADGSFTIYAHLFPDQDLFERLAQSVGQPISAGTYIGHMGNTGNSSGLHLHIEFSQQLNTLGWEKSKNSLVTYKYLKKIVDIMGVTTKYY